MWHSNYKGGKYEKRGNFCQWGFKLFWASKLGVIEGALFPSQREEVANALYDGKIKKLIKMLTLIDNFRTICTIICIKLFAQIVRQ